MAELLLPAVSDRRDAERFVLELDRRLERLDRAILIADFNLYSGRSSLGSSAWQLRRAALLADPRLLSWVRSALRREWTGANHRRLELLERVLLDTQVEQSAEVVRLRSALQLKIVEFRPRWKGKRADRQRIHTALRTARSASDRRTAFYAMEPLNRPLESSLVELVELRNERARSLGFRTFAEMRLGFQGIAPARLLELSESAAALFRSRLANLREDLKRRTGGSGWYPWDFIYARAQQAPLPTRLFPVRGMLPRILRAVREWGFPTERMHFRTVFHDIPAGGLTLAPDPPRDVRILVHPRGGWSSYMVMFHEVGHAVHSASIRSPRHLLRWSENVPGFGAFHEGIAGLFEGIPGRREWLRTVPGLERKAGERFADREKATGPVDAAYHAVWLRTEQRLYENPRRDPMPEVARFERRVFGFDEYPPLSFVDSFFVEDPVYASNYLLAMLFEAQLSRTLQGLFGEPLWPNRKVGPWLVRHWFAPGSFIDWVPHLKEVTGRPFGVAAFREQLAAG